MKNILIVDDDEEFFFFFRKLLPAPHVLWAAKNGVDALLEFSKMDLVFLDMYMPKMSGEEFLLETEFSREKPPLIILMTSEDLPLGEKKEFYRLGVSSIVRKTDNVRDWKKIINYWLEE